MFTINFRSCWLVFSRLLLTVVFLSGLSVSIAYAEDSFIDDMEYEQFESIAEEPSDEFDEFDQFDEFDEDVDAELFDPLGGYNRSMTRFNDKFYLWVLKPVAKGYRVFMQKPPRLAINRFFTNLGFPLRFVNNLLQLKLEHAGIETIRFGVNSTTGLLGLFDPAKDWMELDAYPEDFGQTLGHYGVGGGFHVVLPFFGPSNFRDVCSMAPDCFLNPICYIEDKKVVFALTTLKFINKASLHIEEYEELRKDALDLYPFLRNAYEQNRNKQIEE